MPLLVVSSVPSGGFGPEPVKSVDSPASAPET